MTPEQIRQGTFAEEWTINLFLGTQSNAYRKERVIFTDDWNIATVLSWDLLHYLSMNRFSVSWSLGVGNTKLPVLFQMRNPRFKGSDSSFQPEEKRKWKFHLRLQWHARYQNELEKSHLEKSCQKQGELFNSELLNCSTSSGKCHMTLKEGCRGFLSRRNSDALPSASWRRHRSPLLWGEQR